MPAADSKPKRKRGPEPEVLKIALDPLDGIARLLRPKPAAKKPRKRSK